MTVKITLKILGAIWMVICGYLSASLAPALFPVTQANLNALGIILFFVLLHLTGAIAGFCLLAGATWPRNVLCAVTLLTVFGSVIGLFAWFNMIPFSPVGIAFDIFGLGSAGLFFFSRKH